jgi:hypothetical protein
MPAKNNRKVSLVNIFAGAFIVVFFMLIILIVSSGFFLQGRGHLPQSPQSKALLKARTIGIALWRYAEDHSGTYPSGKTSTEVFQQLIDGKYVSDSAVFYYPLPGKEEPDGGLVLKPDNVSWDVTCCMNATSPDDLPAVFLTGCKITYQAGASAIPSKQTIPLPLNFMAICYKDMSARALVLDPDGSIPHFIPPDFDAKGKNYYQLTPDGNQDNR